MKKYNLVKSKIDQHYLWSSLQILKYMGRKRIFRFQSTEDIWE